MSGTRRNSKLYMSKERDGIEEIIKEFYKHFKKSLFLLINSYFFFYVYIFRNIKFYH